MGKIAIICVLFLLLYGCQNIQFEYGNESNYGFNVKEDDTQKGIVIDKQTHYKTEYRPFFNFGSPYKKIEYHIIKIKYGDKTIEKRVSCNEFQRIKIGDSMSIKW